MNKNMIFKSVTTDGLKLHFHVSLHTFQIPILLAKMKSYYVLFSVIMIITIISWKRIQVEKCGEGK